VPATAPADVQVDELVEQRLQRVARADVGVVGDREPPLARDREAKPVGLSRGPPDLELGRGLRQRAAAEHRQRAQALHLAAQVDPGDDVVGRMAAHGGQLRRRGGGKNPAKAPHDRARLRDRF
jgi:hypothetical protein